MVRPGLAALALLLASAHPCFASDQQPDARHAGARNTPQVQLRVIGTDGKPVPGVTLHYVDSGTLLTSMRTGRDRPHDPETKLRRLGQAVVTAGDGIARWPWDGVEYGTWQAGARLGSQWETVEFSMTARPEVLHELRFAADTSFQVVVTNAEGAPAANIELEALAIEGGPVGRAKENQVLARVVTGPDGIGTFRHVERWTTRIAVHEQRRPFYVGAESPGVWTTAEVDASALPAAPVELRLPPTGTVRIVVRDPFDGRPPPMTFVHLAEHSVWAGRTNGVIDESAGRTFDHVGLGKRYDAWFGFGEEATITFDGPTEAAKPVTIELRTDPCPTLHGTLVRDGKPCADVGINVEGFERGFGLLPRTDAAGRFWLPLGARRRGTTVHQLTLFTGEGFRRDGFTATWSGDLQLDAKPHDLGTLTLKRNDAQAVLVAGRIESEASDLRDADLVLERPNGKSDWPDAAPVLDFDYATGAFTFRGSSPDEDLVLVERGRRIKVTRGETDVLIERAHRDPVAVVAAFPGLDPGLAMCLTPVLLHEYADDSDDGEPFEWRFDGKSLTLQWNDLREGTYRLFVRAPGRRTSVLQVRNIVVPAKGPHQDARLTKLTLPGLRVLAITVPAPVHADPRVKSIDPVRVIAKGQTPAPALLDSGERYLVAAKDPVDLHIRVAGYRDRTLRAVVADTTVTLDPGIAVDLDLDLGSLPPHVARTVTVKLADATAEPFEAVAFEEQGRLRVLLPCPGRYAVAVEVATSEGEPPIVTCDPAELDVTDNGGTFKARAAVSK